jgi:four helix bundle protein
MRKGDDLRERVFRFACDVIALTDSIHARGTSARELARQLMRAATSIGANLEEADAAQSHADFVSKCTISLKEAREAHYWLRLLHSTRKLNGQERLIRECDELVAILTTIVRKAKSPQ